MNSIDIYNNGYKLGLCYSKSLYTYLNSLLGVITTLDAPDETLASLIRLYSSVGQEMLPQIKDMVVEKNLDLYTLLVGINNGNVAAIKESQMQNNKKES